jgi:acyl-CoA hydrolase
MKKTYNPVSAEEAVKVIKSGDRVHIHGIACFPQVLVNAMCDRARSGEIEDVTIQHLHTEGFAQYVEPEFENIFNLESFFVGANVRKATQAGRADYIPVFLCETATLIYQGICPVDVALVQISKPNQHGWVSLGTSVEATRAAIEKAKIVIAVINSHVPKAWGDAMMPLDYFDIFVEHDEPLYEAHQPCISEIDTKIGHQVASLVEDGATLQMGIGAIPNAVLAELGNHRRLGVHTEMFSDGLIPLVEKGIITGEEKKIDKRRIVASFLMGSKALYDFIDDNPMVAMMAVDYTNSVSNIAKNPKVTAINSALQIDLTGQVCADSIGTIFYSGVGGQVDFISGAAKSEGGKPIIAMPSLTSKGVSKIAPVLSLGAGVVTTRPEVHYVVTEYGIAYLYGKSLQKRAKALIDIAHPSYREELEKAAFERFGSHYYFISKKI